jgi:hypothetical protein
MNNFRLRYKRTIFNATILIVLFIGCVNTEGDLEIEGRVIDEYTKTAIPRRKVIIQGLIKNGEKFLSVDAGQFPADSTGRFRYTLKKIKDVRYYNFNFVGDSDYAFKTRMLGLYELEQNAKFLSFELSMLTDLSIRIYRKSRKPVQDTLSLAWVSNDIFYWSLFPYKIYNHDISDNHIGPRSAYELMWIGGHVNSTVKTRVFAEKKTKLYWDLYRNGKRIELTDTITCKRDFANNIYFVY